MIYYFFILQSSNGIFTYPLDDSYIHLKLAKNLAATGILGINIGEFAFLTSSPIWTGLLAIFNLIGIKSTLLPLFLNTIIGLIILYILDVELRKLKLQIMYRIIISILYMAFIPALVITFLGMEHFLHLLLSLIFLIYYRKYFENNNTKKNLILGMLSALLMSTRYESAFIIIPFVILSLLRKNFQKAFIMIIFAAIPVVLFGLYSVINGWYFLPTSLMLKSSQIDNFNFNEFLKFLFYFPLKKLYLNSGITSIISSLLILGYFQYINRQNIKSTDYYITICIISTFLLHLVFAQLGWFYRYEAYLIGIGLLWVILNFDVFKSIKSKMIFKILISLFLMIPIINRSYESHSNIIQASNNIFSQQYQLAGFFAKFYKSEPIAIHDIGAISYYSGIKVIDLWGLANKDIFMLKKNIAFTAENIEKILEKENVKTAAIYTQWFQQERDFYKKWLKAGSWTIQNNISCGEPRINFFAKDSITYIKLVRNLRQYSVLLPNEIYQKINILH